MKKAFFLLPLFFCLLFLPSCGVRIPNSAEAQKKLEALGYEVTIKVIHGEGAEQTGIRQVTVLTASKDGKTQMQAYFFVNQEDTNTFYKSRSGDLTAAYEKCVKRKYSIQGGSKSALADFLS